MHHFVAVSRSYTRGASVSKLTRDKVMQAAQTLGYQPNAIARSLITRRSRMIGVVMSQLDNQFYPLVLEKLSQKLQADGYHVLLFINDKRNADSVLQEILQYQVDGIVLASIALSSALAQQCAKAGIPVVLFNRMTQHTEGKPLTYSSVTSDNFGGGAIVAEHFLAHGLKRMAYVAGLEDSSTSLAREQGFCSTLAQAGLHLHSRAVGGYTYEGAQQAARSLFANPSARPDAVFVASDHMAFAVMDVLRTEMKIAVPDQVSVVGFDDVPHAAWGAYQLTTVSQAVEPMIEATLQLLRERMNENSTRGDPLTTPRTITLPCTLVSRKTVRAVH